MSVRQMVLNGKNTYITTCIDGSIVWEVSVDHYMDMDKAKRIFGEDIMEVYSISERNTQDPIIGKYYYLGSGDYYIVSEDSIYRYERNKTVTKLKSNTVIQILYCIQDEFYKYTMLKFIAT